MLDFSKLPQDPDLAPGEQDFFESCLLAQENAYKEMFGPSEPEGKILSPSDPMLATSWPGGGVYQYAPSARRKDWLYVTYGLAFPPLRADKTNDDPKAISGFGVELAISTPQQESWAPLLLLQLAKYMLSGKDRPFARGDRMQAGIFRQVVADTQLGAIAGGVEASYPGEVRLPCGSMNVVHLVGITPEELERAKSVGGGFFSFFRGSRRGTHVLLEAMRELRGTINTDVKRSSITADPRFEAAWNRALAAVPK